MSTITDHPDVDLVVAVAQLARTVKRLEANEAKISATIGSHQRTIDALAERALDEIPRTEVGADHLAGESDDSPDDGGLPRVVTLSGDELEALEYAADKCHMEAERLLELDYSDTASDLAGPVRLVAFWMHTGDVLTALRERAMTS